MSNISPEANMVLTIASNMIKRGENPPINMTTVLVMELERIKLWRISNMATTSHTDVAELVRAAVRKFADDIYPQVATAYTFNTNVATSSLLKDVETVLNQPPHKAEQ